MSHAHVLYLGILAISWLLAGCSNPIETCSYLALEEVQQLDPRIVSSKYESRIVGQPTNFCIWTDSAGDELLVVNVGLQTTNRPYQILETFKGEDRVELVTGVGTAAAAMFSRQGQGESLEIFLAGNDRWTLDMRSKLVDGPDSAEFQTLKMLANKAFESLD
jgi:hypothetical protein